MHGNHSVEVQGTIGNRVAVTIVASLAVVQDTLMLGPRHNTQLLLQGVEAPS
jgi:hypothetical protein